MQERESQSNVPVTRLYKKRLVTDLYNLELNPDIFFYKYHQVFQRARFSRLLKLTAQIIDVIPMSDLHSLSTFENLVLLFNIRLGQLEQKALDARTLSSSQLETNVRNIAEHLGIEYVHYEQTGLTYLVQKQAKSK